MEGNYPVFITIAEIMSRRRQRGDDRGKLTLAGILSWPTLIHNYSWFSIMKESGSPPPSEVNHSKFLIKTNKETLIPGSNENIE